jgi:outer membrane protein
MRPTTTTTAMLSVTIPIFEGGANTATIDEKLALQDKAQDELVAATRTAGASAREYWSRFHAGVVRVDVLSRVVRSSQAALDATKVGYRVGSRASTDVLRASEAYFANRRDLVRARYATVVALLQLKAAAASLDVDEIARVNELLLNGTVGGGIVADAEAGRKPASAEVKQGVAPADARHSAPVTNTQPALAEADTLRPKFDADVLRALTAIRP